MSSRFSSLGLKSHRALHRAGGWDWCGGSTSGIWLTVCSVPPPTKALLPSLLFLRCLFSSTLCFGLTPWPGVGTRSADKSSCWLRAEALIASWRTDKKWWTHFTHWYKHLRCRGRKYIVINLWFNYSTLYKQETCSETYARWKGVSSVSLKNIFKKEFCDD